MSLFGLGNWLGRDSTPGGSSGPPATAGDSLFVVHRPDNKLFRVALSDGSISEFHAADFNGPTGVAVDPKTGAVYAVDGNAGDGDLYRFNDGDQAVSAGIELRADQSTAPSGRLAFDPRGQRILQFTQNTTKGIHYWKRDLTRPTYGANTNPKSVQSLSASTGGRPWADDQRIWTAESEGTDGLRDNVLGIPMDQKTDTVIGGFTTDVCVIPKHFSGAAGNKYALYFERQSFTITMVDRDTRAKTVIWAGNADGVFNWNVVSCAVDMISEKLYLIGYNAGTGGTSKTGIYSIPFQNSAFTHGDLTLEADLTASFGVASFDMDIAIRYNGDASDYYSDIAVADQTYGGPNAIKWLYYVNSTDKQIRRVRPNGDDDHLVYATGSYQPYGLALDHVNGYIWFGDYTGGKIIRMRMDGTGVEEIVTGLTQPTRMSWNPDMNAGAGKLIYGWANSLSTCDSDGSNNTNILTSAGKNYAGAHYSPVNAKIYYTTQGGTDEFRSCDEDGANDALLDTTDGATPGLCLSPDETKVYVVQYNDPVATTAEIYEWDIAGASMNKAFITGLDDQGPLCVRADPNGLSLWVSTIGGTDRIFKVDIATGTTWDVFDTGAADQVDVFEFCSTDRSDYGEGFGFIYFPIESANEIRRRPLGQMLGTGQTWEKVTSATAPTFVDVDLDSSTMFWTDANGNIYSKNAAGTGAQTQLATGYSNLGMVYYDTRLLKLVFCDDNGIYTMDVDGSNVATVLSDVGGLHESARWNAAESLFYFVAQDDGTGGVDRALYSCTAAGGSRTLLRDYTFWPPERGCLIFNEYENEVYTATSVSNHIQQYVINGGAFDNTWYNVGGASGITGLAKDPYREFFYTAYNDVANTLLRYSADGAGLATNRADLDTAVIYDIETLGLCFGIPTAGASSDVAEWTLPGGAVEETGDLELYIDGAYIDGYINSGIFDGTTSDGGDLRAYIDGVQVPIHVIAWDTAARTGGMFILAPLTVATAATVKITWDGTSVADGVGTTYGRNAVYANRTTTYILNENFNNAANGYVNSAGSNHHATGTSMANNNDAPIAGDQCAEFNGVDDYLTVSDNAALDFTSGYTFAFWTYIDDLEFENFIIDKDNGSSGNGGYEITHRDMAGGGKLDVFNADGTAPSPSIRDNAALGTMAWKRVVATWDGTTAAGSMKLYVDGALRTVTESNFGTALAASTLDVHIGGNPTVGLYLDGRLYNVSMEDNVWTANKVSMDYESQADPAGFFSA